MDVEEIIELIIIKEVEVGLGIDNILIMIEGMIKATVGFNQVQGLILIEIGLDVLNTRNTFVLLKTV